MDHMSENLISSLSNGSAAPASDIVTRAPRILPAMPDQPETVAPVKAKPVKRVARKAATAKVAKVETVARVKRVPAQTIAALRAHRTRAAQEITLIGKPRGKAQQARCDALMAKVADYDARLALLAPTKASKAHGSVIALRATLTRMNKRLKTLAGAARKAYRAEIGKVQSKLDAAIAA